MRNFWVISLLVVYLISLTEFRQLLKFPNLIHHFSEHKAKEKTLTIASFLLEHYTDDAANDGDKDKDMKLPFKSYDGSVSSVLAYVHHYSTTISSKPADTSSTSYLHYSESFLSSAYLSNIWQPPKFC